MTEGEEFERLGKFAVYNMMDTPAHESISLVI